MQQRITADQEHILLRIQPHTAAQDSPEPEVTSKEN